MSESESRKAAIKQLKKKRNFRNSLASYVVINAFMVLIWAVSGAGFFWPVFVMAGWGFAIILQAWNVYGSGSKPISNAEIEREMQHMES